MSKTIEDILAPKPQARHVPLGERQVDPKHGEMLMKTGYRGPISLHVEYLEGDGGAEGLP